MEGIGWLYYTALTIMAAMSGGATSMPPAPPDATVVNVAPEECVFYMSWSGRANVDPESTNHTERLLAEKEVQLLFATIEKVALTSLKNNGVDDALIHKVALPLKTLLSQPAAYFVQQAKPSPTGVGGKGGAIIRLGDNAEEIGATLRETFKKMVPNAKTVTIAGSKWDVLPEKDGTPQITWGIKGRYLIIGVGEGSVEGILRRARTPQPKWLADLKKSLPVQRVATVGYLNIKAIRTSLGPIAKQPQVAKVLQQFGADNISHIGSVSGLDGDRFVAKDLLALDGQPQGVLKLINGKPLTKEDLKVIPKDSIVALAGRLDLNQVQTIALEILGGLQPQAVAIWKQGIARAKKDLDLDVQKDLIEALGDRWCLYASKTDGGLWLTGLTLVVSVKDPTRLDAALRKMEKTMVRVERRFHRFDGDRDDHDHDHGVKTGATRPARKRDAKEAVKEGLKEDAADKAFEEFVEEVLEAEAGDTGGEKIPAEKTAEKIGSKKPEPDAVEEFRFPMTKRFKFGKQEITVLNVDEPGFFFSPSWCVTKDSLVVGLFPQSVKSHLVRQADPRGTLADVPEVAAALKSENGPVALGYLDMRSIVRTLYPIMQVFAQLGASKAQQNGIKIDISALPSAASILPHLRPNVVAVSRTPAGIVSERRHTIPSGNVTTTAPLAIAILLPAIQAVRHTARKTQSMGNMRSITIAMHSYATATGEKLPGDILDKDGKPLLSWRVRLLPYIDAQPYYRRFKLDEPWDSKHNKKLLAAIPPIYVSPTSNAPDNATVYLRPTGKGFVMNAHKSVGLAMRDGASRTALLVEASDARAVPWTKPDDIAIDVKSPLDGLIGQSPNGFNVAFADGRVNFIHNSIDLAVWRAMLTPAGGKDENPHLPRDPSPKRPRAKATEKAPE